MGSFTRPTRYANKSNKDGDSWPAAAWLHWFSLKMALTTQRVGFYPVISILSTVAMAGWFRSHTGVCLRVCIFDLAILGSLSVFVTLLHAYLMMLFTRSRGVFSVLYSTVTEHNLFSFSLSHCLYAIVNDYCECFSIHLFVICFACVICHQPASHPPRLVSRVSHVATPVMHAITIFAFSATVFFQVFFLLFSQKLAFVVLFWLPISNEVIVV